MQATRTTFFYEKAVRWLVPASALAALSTFLYISPAGVFGKLDAVGYAVCHRIASRSFHVHDHQLPLCARCTGEFMAAALTLIYQIAFRGRRSRLPSRPIVAVLIVFAAAFIIDGSNSYLYLLKQTSEAAFAGIPNLYLPNNTLRLLTGSGMGIALAAVLFPIINQTLWLEPDPGPALEWRQFLAINALVLVADLLILTGLPAMLYSAAILSVLGVLSLFVMVFGILWIIILHQDNTFNRISELWLPSLAGLTMCFLLITGIDLARFTLTGTWGGFPGIQG
jgi:uncharacterized membrane protein